MRCSQGLARQPSARQVVGNPARLPPVTTAVRMPALMGTRLALLLSGLVLGLVLGACGKEIGDACIIGSDCSPNGDRLCDPASVGGYCTIQGCDYGTCPDEAACIRFFTGNFTNKTCDPKATDADCEKQPELCCSLDELCSIEGATDQISGHCVPRSSEIRYCMRTCDSDGDCRDGYECRDLEKMKAHGGEPVLEAPKPGAPRPVVDESSPKFCAAAPVTP